MKLSVSSYSFHQKTKTGEMTLFDCITKAKEMGFEAIEFTELPGDSLEAQTTLAAELKTAADTIGLDICAYVVGAKLYQETEEASDAEVKRLFGQVEIAHLLGAKIFRHDVCSSLGKSGNARSFDLMLPTIAKNARRVTEYAQGLGIRTCTENHGTIAQDSDRVERLFNAVHHDNYGLLVDIGNFACVDESSITAVSRTAPYAIHVHIKDIGRKNISPPEAVII